MTEVSQAAAERFTVQARRASSLGEHEAAINQQREAVRIVERDFASLPEDSPALADERKEYAHRLSDYWGRLGGFCRKAGRVADAVEAYRHGMEIEREYKLDDSYCRTNWIVMQLLDDPARLPTLRGEIESAIALIQVQVEGPRRGQWWAWADLGLLCHLGGRAREAWQAYRRFQQAGARRADHQSVLYVLRSLQERLAPSEPGLAAEMGETIEFLGSAADRPAR